MTLRGRANVQSAAIALSGYRCHAARKRKPELLCARAKRDELDTQIQAVWQANMQVYGATRSGVR